MKKSVLFFLLLAGALLLAGCQKEERNDSGNAVRFSAATPGTKTAYSGEVSTTNIERIDWVAGDLIRVYSDKAENRYNSNKWADYKITSVTENGIQSDAKISNVDNPDDTPGTGLVWGEAGDYLFFAAYPNNASSNGSEGKLNFVIPAAQSLAAATSTTLPRTPDMSYAIMSAAKKVTTTKYGEGEDITLLFEPEFTAFEFTFDSDIAITLKSFEISAASEAPALAGPFTVNYTYANDAMSKTYDFTGATEKTITVSDLEDTEIEADVPFAFTVFALPQDLSGLTITYTVIADDWAEAATRKLVLNKKNGTPVEFAGGNKHRISGTIQGSGSFKYITLTGEVLEWIPVTVSKVSDNIPQSTQFSVSLVPSDPPVEGAEIYNLYEKYGDAYKSQRQTWVLGDNTAAVSFKVFSPLDGTYNIIPYILIDGGTESDDISDYFQVSGDLTGTIGVLNLEDHHTHTATRVSFTVKALQAGAQLFFRTYVTDTDGNTSSLDSETQLFDSRGFHYFRYDDPVNP